MDERSAALEAVARARARLAEAEAEAAERLAEAEATIIAAYRANATLADLRDAMGIKTIEGARKVLLKHKIELRPRGRAAAPKETTP